MKPMTDHDQNWHWPENTWFRERLNALKARENEERRKTPSRLPREQVSTQPSHAKDELKVG